MIWLLLLLKHYSLALLYMYYICWMLLSNRVVIYKLVTLLKSTQITIRTCTRILFVEHATSMHMHLHLFSITFTLYCHNNVSRLIFTDPGNDLNTEMLFTIG